MHVTYAVTRSDAIGGAVIHVRDLAVEMRERGHEASVVVGGEEGPFLDHLEARGIPHRTIPHLVGHPFHLWTWPPALLEIRAALEELGPELVSCHTSNAGFLGRLAAASLGIPAIFTAHGWAFTEGKPLYKQVIFRAGETLAARFARRVVTVSDYDRRLARELRVAPERKLVTIHNGMPDVDPGLRADPAVEPPTLVMVARFEDQKDHDTLLRALAALHERAWRLELVGDGPRMERVERLAEGLGLADRVDFLGHRDDVAEVLSRAQLFVLASRWEGFPRTILEAMRAGLPVVASDVAGVPESVADGETGRVVRAEDPVALADALGELLGAPARRAAMGEAGRARYEEHFTFARMAGETVALYLDVLEEVGEG